MISVSFRWADDPTEEIRVVNMPTPPRTQDYVQLVGEEIALVTRVIWVEETRNVIAILRKPRSEAAAIGNAWDI